MNISPWMIGDGTIRVSTDKAKQLNAWRYPHRVLPDNDLGASMAKRPRGWVGQGVFAIGASCAVVGTVESMRRATTT
jgi:hypothetical protein